jgi:hypothetical protein
MSILLLDSSPAGLPTAKPAVGSQRERILRGVHSALSLYHPSLKHLERRSEPRFPYPYPFHLTPLSDTGVILVNATLSVIGRHLSEHGLDFYHREPFPYRRAIATLPAMANQWLGMVIELTRTRLSSLGWYDYGARIVGLVEPAPMAEVA